MVIGWLTLVKIKLEAILLQSLADLSKDEEPILFAVRKLRAIIEKLS